VAHDATFSFTPNGHAFRQALRILGCVFVSSVLSILFATGLTAGDEPWGQEVIEVRIEPDANLSTEDFRAQIVQKVGEPLDPSKVAQSLKNLYATGRFTDLRADWEPRDQGIALIFVAKVQYFVGVVNVEGAPGAVEARVLVNASRLKLGQPLAESDLVAARRHLTQVLADNGYFQATVASAFQKHPETQEADVTFVLTTGRAAKLSKVQFEGVTGFPPQKLTSVSGWRSGKQLTASRLERGLSKLRQFYLAKGRLQATTNVVKRVFDSGTNTETLVVQCDAGPQVHVRVLGASLSRSKMRELLPLYREGAVDEIVLSRGQEALEDYFQRKGYFTASVRVNKITKPNPPAVDITYSVSLGPQGRFSGYTFEGNHSVSTSDLTEALSSDAPNTPHPLSIFSNRLLTQYLKAIRDHYRLHGFLEAEVTPHLDDRTSMQPPSRTVTFRIKEGPRTLIEDLTIQGMAPEMQKAMWPVLSAKPGQPYSPEAAQADRDSMIRFLADRGYSDPTVTWQARPGTEPHTMDLDYEVRTGEQEKVRRVVLLGIQHTRAGVVWRAINIQQGQPLSLSGVMESQRALYDLGLFSQVQITTQDPQVPEVSKTVLVSVEETRRWSVAYGGGFEVQRLGSNQPQGTFKFSPRGSLDVTRLNVGGRDQFISFRGRLSVLEKSALLTYYIPHFQSHRTLALRISGLFDRSQDVLTYTAERSEASLSLEKHFSPSTLLVGRYSFRNVLVDQSTLKISPDEIPLFSLPARIGMLGASFARDHRDNPLDATKGSYNIADAGVSWRGFGSEAGFARFSGQNATYYKIGTHLIFARSTRFGLESPIGSPRLVNLAPSGQPPHYVTTNEIPLPEKFFMGGSESHRGFSINQAGPRDPTTGFPIGGNALFLNSLELRMPFRENRYGVVLFHDFGNVFSAVGRMRIFKVTQSSPLDFDYGSHALGAGFRYKTPVGPVRLDFGYNLNPPRFQVLNDPTRLFEVRQLSHFQFFFSIGQTF
jgi:outer membrane protein insertion porin family